MHYDQIHCVGSGGNVFSGHAVCWGTCECTKKVGNEAKPACTVSLASLNLTPDQKTKMDAAMEEHHKAGCSEASEAKYRQEAKTILNKEQFAKFKAECKGEKDKAKTET